MSKINKEILLFSYNGPIEDSRTQFLFKSVVSQIEMLEGVKVKGVLISLKGTAYIQDHKDLAVFVKKLSVFEKKLGVVISLIDYSIPLYQILKPLTKSTRIKLFKNSSAARIFLDAKAFKKGMSVLVYDKDEDNSRKLSSELVSFGYSVVVAKDDEEYKSLMKGNYYELIVTHSSLNLTTNKSAKAGTKLSLSKKLIANLPLFMDTSVETLVSFTGMEAHKSAHSIKRFNVEASTDSICAVMHFSGDIKGAFVLVFPRDIACIAMESLLGEEVNESDTESILDGVGEFCNIITGSIKTALSNKEIKVLFELPKKFTSLEETFKDIGDDNGIWIDMQLSKKPFYMFISS